MDTNKWFDKLDFDWVSFLNGISLFEGKGEVVFFLHSRLLLAWRSRVQHSSEWLNSLRRNLALESLLREQNRFGFLGE
jgi:hypothetical protein